MTVRASLVSTETVIDWVMGTILHITLSHRTSYIGGISKPSHIQQQ